LIDHIEDGGFNAVYFQVRPVGDALYQSSIEPWSRYITGTQGTAPNPLWDPLQFVIDYCKPKNIEVHAWINPYRANMAASTAGLAPNHMAREIPECARMYHTFLWMDPGCSRVQDRTYAVAIDLITRYDLDGLHMDDYFYPYPQTGLAFPDNATYAEYQNSGGNLGRDDWRRDNVNKLVERLNIGLHEVKPWIKFSISPFGIYRPGHPEGMPPPIVGLDQYSAIYCDPKKWMIEGWVDILQPQLYWKIDPPAQSYPTLLAWFVASPQNPRGRHVYAGNYLSQIDPTGGNWDVYEIHRQVDISREVPHREKGSWGNVHFSAKMIRDDVKGCRAFFKVFTHPLPAFQPPFPWLSNATFSQIQEIKPIVEVRGNLIHTSVTTTTTMTQPIDGLFHKAGIFREADGDEWNLIKVIPLAKETFFSFQVQDLPTGNYALVYLNRFGQESRKTFFTI